MSSPTQRSLALMRSQGYVAEVVERFIMGANIRKDLFDFVDIACLKQGETGLTAVQTTTVAHQANRIEKILGNPKAKMWLETGNRIIVHGWAKKGERGKRKLWQVTEQWITLPMFEVRHLTPV